MAHRISEKQLEECKRILKGDWFYGNSRNCAEKMFAFALYRAGVKRLYLSASHWVGKKPSVDGLVLETTSIVAEPFVRLPNEHTSNVLWVLLKHVGIASSGCAGGSSAGDYMQASWSAKSTKHKGQSQWVNMNLALLVCYFNEICELEDGHG
jgi:hypothetical protein